mgnify:CR=1 FL=1
MTKVIIIGGAGYIGSVLTKMLLDEGHSVTILDNFRFQQNSLLDCCHYKNFFVIRGDCRDYETVKNTLKDQKVIIPLAALVGAPLCDTDQTAALSTNIDAKTNNSTYLTPKPIHDPSVTMATIFGNN